MKRLVLILLTVVCCAVCAAGPALADRKHVAENIYAQSDYLVFSPEYSTSGGTWEMWLMAYKL